MVLIGLTSWIKWEEDIWSEHCQLAVFGKFELMLFG